MRPNPVKAKLARGETAFGTMILDLRGPGLARIFENAGAEFVMFDMEAACWDIGTIKDQLAMCRGLDIVPFVNAASQDAAMLQQPLDCGAMGLMVPVVETRAQAEQIARATHYPPHGARGVAFGIAHDDYSLGGIEERIAAADERTMIIAKIETMEGVQNIDEILAVDGIDAAFVGHMDLSASLDVAGDYEHPRFVEAVETVIAACERHDKPGVCLVATPEAATLWMVRGFRMVMYSTETMLLAAAYRSGLEAIKAG